MPRFRVALFGLTGFGNAAMRAICASGHELLCLVTREEAGPFPYYDEKDIGKEARQDGIPVWHGSAGEKVVAAARPDIILVATYHRRIALEVIRSARCAFNIHPSLLPRYRGTTPYFWAMRNGEKKTGITIHDLTGTLDRGDIVIQRELKIGTEDTQGSLRHSLADKAYTAVLELLDQLSKDIVTRTPQREELASYNPRPGEEDRILKCGETAEQVCRHIRALLPYPKAIIKDPRCLVEAIVAVDLHSAVQAPAGTVDLISGDLIRIRVADAQLTLRISRYN